MAKPGFLHLMFSLLFATLRAILSVNSPNITTDQSALLALKSHISHDPHNLLTTNWSTSVSVCNWIGITCGSNHHRVTTLNLSSMDLTGTIPSQLGNLSFLVWLNVRYNSFHGALPIELTNLRRLRYLNLGNNSFQGEIPSWFGQFGKLRSLLLYRNFFIGVIPSTLGNLSNLETLLLYNNDFKGEIPSVIGNLIYLDAIDFANNNLTGSLDKLQVLILRSNRLYGRIDDSRVTISFARLRVIDFSHNNFDGYLPTKIVENLHAIRGWNEKRDELKNMMNTAEDGTRYFVTDISFATKGLEREFQSLLTTWMAIDFSNNQFFGEIPKMLGELHSLVVLNLSHNCLAGPIPSSLGDLSELESLDLSSSILQGRIPTELKNLGFLEVLNLSYNSLVGPIPQAKSCDDEEETSSKFDPNDDDDGLNWKFSISMGYGCGLVLGLSMGYIAFVTGKPWWFIEVFERVQQKFAKWLGDGFIAIIGSCLGPILRVEFEALATTRNDSKTVLKFLHKYIFTRFGVPQAIISDEGTHFDNKLIAKALKRYVVRHKISTSYHPQTNDQTEIFNRKIKQILEKVVNPRRKDLVAKVG
ncbi:receptor-like protein 18 [Hibiscus syriacus]|uniref:receptor-like protein 18 n=1 Tax=Hibiscus syriacus TaxID=106335 RepID=UPI00192430C1|nr:receptor-like protein 18 [Hibiscus syriacus]